MTPRSFDYVQPSTLEQALSILDSSSKNNTGAKFLAGGQSLVPLMKLRLVTPDLLIDINEIKELSYIIEHENWISVGAMTRYKDILSSILIKEAYPILVDAVESIADTQIRNRGTVGGNVCHADPSSDLAPALIALKASFKVLGLEGKSRTIQAENFFLDLFTPNLESGEILSEINIPKPAQKSFGTYLKFTEVSGGFAIVGVAFQLSLDSVGLIKDAGVGLASVGPTPIRGQSVEKQLLGKKPSKELIQEAASEASKLVALSASDVQASTRYRKQLVEVLFKRAASKTLEELGVEL